MDVSDEETENESSEIITHTAVFQIFEQVLQYVGHQADECMAADVILYGNGVILAQKKTSAKQISVDAFVTFFSRSMKYTYCTYIINKNLRSFYHTFFYK